MRGNWIWINNKRDIKNQFVYFRKEIKYSNNIKQIKINISLADKYKLYINNKYIGVGPSPATPQYQYYDTYVLNANELNIKDQICIAVVGYNLGTTTEIVTKRNQAIPAFRFEAEIELTNNQMYDIYSDETWKTLYSPAYFRDLINLGESRISNWSGFKEIFESIKEPKGWKNINYNDSEWHNTVNVVDAEEVFKNLIPREIPFLHTEFVYPNNVLQIENYNGKIYQGEKLLKDDNEVTCIDASKPGSFPSVVLDFGKEVVGYLQVELTGSEGSNMSIWYGESLDLMRVDTLILSGKWQKYEPFNRRAFRYLKLTFNNSMEKIQVKNVKLLMTHYDYRDISYFKCSDKLLNKIYQVSKYTVKLGSQEHFEDSIWREEMQWLADARVMSLVNYWTFGDSKLPAKAIKQFFRIQLPDGTIPASGPQMMDAFNVDFCMHFIEMIYEHYYYSKDLSIIKQYYCDIERLMKRFEKMEDEDGLIEQDGKLAAFIDWAVIDRRGKITFVNCFYYKIINIFIEISNLINYPLDTNKYENKAIKVKSSIINKMYNKDLGLFTDCLIDKEQSINYSQQTNMFAVYAGIVEEDKAKEFINRIYSTDGLETIKGAFLLSFVVDLLFKYGLYEKALFMLKDFWGEMINRGATTWWETFDRTTPRSSIPYLFTKNTPTYLSEYIPVSHCHGWGAGPAYILPKYILGIKPLKPNFEEIEFSPYIDGIDECEGVIPTKYGDINVLWHKDEHDNLIYSIDKPQEIKLIVNI